MYSIVRATENDSEIISRIGKVSVVESHQGSNPEEVLNQYVDQYYNEQEIKKQLADPRNNYYLIRYNDQTAGFSNLVLNSRHLNIVRENSAKLDRIYLLKEFQGLKLGLELLKFNIDLSKKNNQSGIWLYSWIGNTKAVDFYTRAGFKIIGRYDFKVTATHSDPSHQMLLDFAEAL